MRPRKDLPPSRGPPSKSTPNCPATPPPSTIDIPEADPEVDRAHHDEMRQKLIDNLDDANTTIRLGPNVVLDFADMNDQVLLRFLPHAAAGHARVGVHLGYTRTGHLAQREAPRAPRAPAHERLAGVGG